MVLLRASRCCLCFFLFHNVAAFQSGVPKRRPAQTTTCLAAELDENSSRRQFFGAIGMGIIGSCIHTPLAAEASYSAYTHREEDWKQRKDAGDVQYSSAQSLRSQLREIAPANDSGRQLFCPNGASAAVTPLMENRCGDRMAIPSVYGRTEDALGNSIPGFSGGFYDSGVGGRGSGGGAEIGGLPNYSSFTANTGGAQRAR